METKVLINAVALANKVAQQRSYMPGLEQVNITVFNNTMMLRSTNLDTWLASLVPADNGDEVMNVAVKAKTLLTVLRKLKTADLRFQVHEDKLRVMAGKRKIELPTYPVEDLPIWPDVDTDATPVVLHNPAFIKAWEWCGKTVSTDPTRKHINVLHMEPEDGNVRLVATDGHRLHSALLKSRGLEQEIDVPQNCMSMLLKVCKEAKADAVVMKSTDKHTQFTCGLHVLTCEVPDTKFTPYRHVIPSEFDMVANVDAHALRESMDLMNSLTDGVDFTLSNTLKCTSSDDTGDVQEEIELHYDKRDIAEIQTRFNPKYIIEAASGWKGMIALKAQEGGKGPIVLQHDADLAVVLPQW